jgi:YD repeat-containing protein
MPAVRRRLLRQWGITIIAWLLCVTIPLVGSMRLRDAPADAPGADVAWPVGANLLRDRLLIGVQVAPLDRLAVAAGTAEVVAWSPGGQYLAVGDSSGSVLLWDVGHQRLSTLRWRAHRRFVSALTWSPDGRVLVSAAGDGSVILWKVAAGSLVAQVRLHINARVPYVPAAAISAEGRWLAVADGQGSVSIWDLAGLVAQGSGSSHTRNSAPSTRGRPAMVLHVSGHTTALAWSPSGRRLAVGTAAGQVILWTAHAPWPRVTQALGSAVWAIAWSPNGTLLAAGNADGAVRLLGGSTLQVRALLLAPFQRTPVLHVPDYGSPSSASGRSGPKTAAGAAINGLAWSPSGDLLSVTATGVPLRFWQPSRGGVLTTYRDNWDLNAVAWRSDGRRVAVARDDGSVLLLDVQEPRSTPTTWLCGLLGPHWCPPLLGTQPYGPAESSVPPSYMSR